MPRRRNWNWDQHKPLLAIVGECINRSIHHDRPHSGWVNFNVATLVDGRWHLTSIGTSPVAVLPSPSWHRDEKTSAANDSFDL